MVADESDKDVAMTDGLAVPGAADTVLVAVAICVFDPVKSCVPRLFTKNLNEPTARSKPDSNPAKVSWNSGGCGVKSAVGSNMLFAGEAVDAFLSCDQMILRMLPDSASSDSGALSASCRLQI